MTLQSYWISHDLTKVAKYADHVVLLDKTVASRGIRRKSSRARNLREFSTQERNLGERRSTNEYNLLASMKI